VQVLEPKERWTKSEPPKELVYVVQGIEYKHPYQ
jgi:hypothetical protein